MAGQGPNEKEGAFAVVVVTQIAAVERMAAFAGIAFPVSIWLEDDGHHHINLLGHPRSEYVFAMC